MFDLIHSAAVIKVDFVVRKDSECRREEARDDGDCVSRTRMSPS